MGGWEQRASLGTRKLGLRPRERHPWCSAVPALRGQPRGLLPGARLGGRQALVLAGHLLCLRPCIPCLLVSSQQSWREGWYPHFTDEGSEAQGLDFPKVTEPVGGGGMFRHPPLCLLLEAPSFPEPHLP